MPRATWLKTVLAKGGLEVIEYPGWETRGDTRLTVNAVVRHHTATGQGWTDDAVDRLLWRDGNATTPPPLAQLGLDRRGRYRLGAAGRCNHNGYGRFGNDAIGIEAYNDGVGEPWPKVQVDAYDLGVALILEHLDLPTERDVAPYETDPNRKSDPRGLVMVDRRKAVARIRASFHQPPPEDPDDMPAIAPFSHWRDVATGRVYRVGADALGRVWLQPAELKVDQALLRLGGFPEPRVLDAVAPAKAGDFDFKAWLNGIPILDA
jgi:hypothetical protein